MKSHNLWEKVEFACRDRGIKLKPLCAKANVSYGTLHQQLTRRSNIPFQTIDAIAAALDLPLDHFSDQPRAREHKSAVIREIIGILEDYVDPQPEAPSRPDTSALWARLNQTGFKLEGLGDLLEYCDIYYPLAPEDAMPHPESFGRLSLSREFLHFDRKRDYYQKVEGFDPKMRKRSMTAHQMVKEQPFSVASETISEVIDGNLIKGCYLRAAARVSDASNREKTLIFTQFVGFGGEQQLDLPTR